MKKRIHILVVALVGAFFLFTGATKALDPVEFARSVSLYQTTGPVVSLAVALYIPWVECFAAIALFFPSWRRAAGILLLVLLVVFELVLASAYLRGLDIDCGCLGNAVESGVVTAMIRNLFLAGGLAFVLNPDRGRG